MTQSGTRETKLAPKQIKAIAALLLVGNVQDAARAAGIGRRTLCRADARVAKLRANNYLKVLVMARGIVWAVRF